MIGGLKSTFRAKERTWFCIEKKRDPSSPRLIRMTIRWFLHVILSVSEESRRYAKHSLKRSQAGFTIIEILVAIVVIGITVPAIMIPFSGLGDTKNPEYVIQGSFIGQKKIEELASKFRDTITTVCPEGTAATSTDGDYSLDCVSEQVNATDPDTSTTSTFARKVTLTVSRTDGAMSPLVFNSLFALDS